MEWKAMHNSLVARNSGAIGARSAMEGRLELRMRGEYICMCVVLAVLGHAPAGADGVMMRGKMVTYLTRCENALRRRVTFNNAFGRLPGIGGLRVFMLVSILMVCCDRGW
jgi:hypothetical protein